MIPQIELSRLDLDPSGSLRRKAPRPRRYRQADYDEKFDALTVLYDCFLASDGETVVCLGPPLFNLKRKVLRPIESAFHIPFFSRRDLRCLDHVMQLRLLTEVRAAPVRKNRFQQAVIKVQPNHCELFRCRRALMTISKDNELTWIRDWVHFHATNHGCDAVLMYDNNSTKYDTDRLRDTISSVPGIAVAVVVKWPFPFGPGGGPSRAWDSDFAQYAMLEHGRHRFLAHAEGVINADVDELVMTVGGLSVFELAKNSQTGYLQYTGTMIENVSHLDGSDTVRHANFRYRNCPPRSAIRKWTVVPTRCPENSQWLVHDVVGMQPDQSASAQVEHRHFAGITTGWRRAISVPAPHPTEAHAVDEEAVRFMQCIAEGAEGNHEPTPGGHPGAGGLHGA